MIKVYTHRSGHCRESRKTGPYLAYPLEEKGKVARIEKEINKKFEKRSLPSGDEICEQLFNFVDQIEKVKVNEEESNGYCPLYSANWNGSRKRILSSEWYPSSLTG